MKGSTITLADALTLAARRGATVREEPVQPLEAPKVTKPAMVELDKKLFFYPRLSRSRFIWCSSCHNLSIGGSDNLKT